MKKKLLSVLLCLCMTMTLTPSTAWATEPDDGENSPESLASASTETTEPDSASEPEVTSQMGELDEEGIATLADSSTYEQLSYQLNGDNTITITDCDSSAKTVTIPEKIDGIPVTSIGNWAFSDCSNLTSIYIPDGVTSIEGYTFNGCSGLASVRIPDSITSISFYAFKDCSSLTSIYIPDGTTLIGPYAFSGCSGLTDINIPDSVKQLLPGTFENCSGLKKVIIPASVISMGGETKAGIYGVFSNCINLTSAGPIGSGCSIEFGWKETIPALTFMDCDKLKSIYLPDSITDIGESAFQGCNSLTDASIPNSVNSIGRDAFWGCRSLTSVCIPDGVPSISRGAFAYCYSLTNVSIPNSVTSIGDKAFEGCSGLTSVTIPDSITSIGEYAFSGCSSLTSVTIPDSVTSIEMHAFSDCNSLTSVSIPDSVTEIGKSYFENSIAIENIFENCSKLTSISVDENNTQYASDKQGLLFDKSKFILICCPGGKTDLTIPNSVVSISSDAFSGCSSLTSVTIPDSVAYIGYDAFDDCSSLRTAGPIGGGYNYEFGWTKTIPANAFNTCSGLTSVTIPGSVTSIGGEAFSGCSGLKDVYYAGSEEQWKEISINGGNAPLKNATIHYNSSIPEPVTSAPELPEESVSVEPSNNTVTVTVPEMISGVQAPIQNVLCAFSDSSDASVPASEYKTGSVAEQGQTVQITPDDKNYRTVKIFTLDDQYRPVCKPTIVQIPASS